MVEEAWQTRRGMRGGDRPPRYSPMHAIALGRPSSRERVGEFAGRWDRGAGEAGHQPISPSLSRIVVCPFVVFRGAVKPSEAEAGRRRY